MRKQRGSLSVLALVTGLAIGGAAASARTLDAAAEEVLACVERNAPSSARQRVRLERTDRSGHARRLEATIWWRRDAGARTRLVARVEAPASERGTAFLLVEGEHEAALWSYLPAMRGVRRVTGRAVSGSFFASDFTYEDIARLHGEARDAHVARLPDAERDGRPVYVLEGRPAEGTPASHRRIVTFVDRETCVVLGADLEGPTGAVQKQLRIAWPDVEQQGFYWRARRIAMRDLARGSESQLVLTESDWDAEIPERRFHPNELSKAW